MKIRDVLKNINETTTAGAVATVSAPMGKTRKRKDKGIYASEGYPDDMDFKAHDRAFGDPNEQEREEAYKELDFLANRAAKYAKQISVDEKLNPRDPEDFAGLLQTLVDKYVYGEFSEEQRELIDWKEMEEAVAKVLKGKK